MMERTQIEYIYDKVGEKVLLKGWVDIKKRSWENNFY